MKKETKNLLFGVIIGASAGFIAGVVLYNRKNQKADKLKSKITSLATEAQQKINALKEMAREREAAIQESKKAS